MEPTQPRDLIDYFITSFNIPANRINWGFQMKILKSLLLRYTMEEVKYAIDYYKKKGVEVYSLGWLKFGTNMSIPSSLLLAEKYAKEGGSGERNRKRIEQHNKTKRGTDAPEHLFTEA